LLEQVQGSGVSKRGRDVSRKDRRKAERAAKKGGGGRRQAAFDRAVRRQTIDDEEGPRTVPTTVVRPQPAKDAKPSKSILKTRPPAPLPSPTPETEIEDDDDSDDVDLDESSQSDAASDDSFTISRSAAKAGLADEDDEIAALERRLGIKGSQHTKDVGADELEWLVAGSESEDEGLGMGRKRKRPEDERWLRDKRAKAGGSKVVEGVADSATDGEEDEEGGEEVENPFSDDDELSGDDFGGFDSDEEDASSAAPIKPLRENPYVAPRSEDATPASAHPPIPKTSPIFVAKSKANSIVSRTQISSPSCRRSNKSTTRLRASMSVLHSSTF
jgi:nucleolar MIF4G domain-containing protein 1